MVSFVCIKVKYLMEEPGMYYVCPEHPNIMYTRPGYCRMAKRTWRQCKSCGDVNPQRSNEYP